MPRSAPAPVVFVTQPELAAVARLLESAGLPTTDLTAAHLEHFFYCGPKRAPSGLVGVELYGVDALLRSLWVAPEARTQGMGSSLVEHAEDHAGTHGVRTMYLLTMSAEGFFAQLGYRRVARASVPLTIQGSREFRELCPESSALMAKVL